MASELYNTIDALSREKGIDPQIVVNAVEDAIVVATRKYYKTQENLRAQLDKDTGKIRAFAVKTIVEAPEQVEDPTLQVTLEEALKSDPNAQLGGELQIPKETEGILGRIAAQLAKQVIFQKVREAERDTVYNEYIGRVGEIINATVKRIEGPDVIFDIGKAEARAPRKEQSRLESFAIGERVRVVIARVEKASKGPAVVVSRAAPELVQHLFQTEVPEIYDGTVVIRAIAREAGERTKIAVMSKDKDVDAVGACIGKKGQNVRLAAKLLGWKIDIKSEEEKRQEVELQMSALVGSASTPLENVPGLGEGLIEKLSAAGVSTVESLADMTPEQLEAIEGIGPKTVEKISLAVNNYFAGLEAGEAGEAQATPAEGEEIPAEAVAEESAASAEGAAEPTEVVTEEAASEEVAEDSARATTSTAAEDAGQAESPQFSEQPAPSEDKQEEKQ